MLQVLFSHGRSTTKSFLLGLLIPVATVINHGSEKKNGENKHEISDKGSIFTFCPVSCCLV